MPAPHEAITMHAAAPSEVEASLISPDVGMLILTWVVFFLLLVVLHKFAWKPVLHALDEREATIRQSLDDAERISLEMQKIDETCARILGDARAEAATLIEEARRVAKDAAEIIETRARESAKISLENALRDIKEETQKAQMKLREESAGIAVELAGKIIEANMTAAQNRKLIDQFIAEMESV